MNRMPKLNFRLILILLCAALISVQAACFAQRAAALAAMPIMGDPVATKRQCLSYLLKINPKPSIAVSPENLVEHYYEEGKREGVRPDIAFAQAMHETGFFRYGGLVSPNQNNYCGLGSMGVGENGARFSNPRLGVRAHIQHILAYSSTRLPAGEIVDPRYALVKTTGNFGAARTWMDLNGKWAVPGTDYAQRIMSIYSAILAER